MNKKLSSICDALTRIPGSPSSSIWITSSTDGPVQDCVKLTSVRAVLLSGSSCSGRAFSSSTRSPGMSPSRSATWADLALQSAWIASKSVSTNISNAVTRPAISSLHTFAARPIASELGDELAYAASIRSARPARIPVDCGPSTPLPPLKLTMSAPWSRYLLKFSGGGSIAAASTMTGTSRACAVSTTLLSGSAPPRLGP